MKTAQEALIIVDAQNDFGHENGSLYVKGGELIIPEVNRLINKIRSRSGIIIATKDWHPENHTSFASRFGLTPFSLHNGEMKWPNHCVANTWGAELMAGIENQDLFLTVLKGTDPEIDSYSGFGGKIQIPNLDNPSLGEFLTQTNTKILHIVGLATDYCVKATALDAQKLGFQTIVHTA